MAKVFISYSHADEELRNELEKHLAALRHQGVITVWHDRRVEPGEELHRQIVAELQAADIVLLLVSADFLGSEYCYEVEMQQAIERHDRNDARVIPVILRPCEWQIYGGVALDGFGLGSRKGRSRTALFFQAKLDQGYGAIVSTFPEHCSAEAGLAVAVVVDHVARAFGLEEDRIREVCGSPAARTFGGSYSSADNCFHLDHHRLEDPIDLVVNQSGG